MVRLLRVSYIDFKFILKNKALLFTLAITLAYTILFFFYSTNYSKMDRDINTYYRAFYDISYYIFLIVPALSLSKEYSFKTTRILYTGIFSKNQVFLYKILSTLFFLIVLGFLHRLIGNIFWGLDQNILSFKILSNSIVETTLIYLLTGIFTISLAFFFSLISYSRLSTVIFTVAIFILERYIRGILFLILENKMFLSIIEHNPLAIIQFSLQYGRLSIMDGIILVFLSAVLFCSSLILINKKAVN
ncbi:hypothetical protein [Niallia sp. BSM11]|uniref:hypothetical protein n=1 Tax=Niallia sp. BSM11 TaxID=3391576 RepID=UPI00398567B3